MSRNVTENCTIKYRIFSLFPGLGRFVNTGDGVQTAWITNIWQTLGDDPYKKCGVVSQIHIAACMGNELWFTTALSR